MTVFELQLACIMLPIHDYEAGAEYDPVSSGKVWKTFLSSISNVS